MKSNTVRDYEVYQEMVRNGTDMCKEDTSRVGLFGLTNIANKLTNNYTTESHKVPGFNVLQFETLVTGAMGFIGANYVKKLLRQKRKEIHELKSYDNGTIGSYQMGRIEREIIGIQSSRIILTDYVKYNSYDEFMKSALVHAIEKQLLEETEGQTPAPKNVIELKTTKVKTGRRITWSLMNGKETTRKISCMFFSSIQQAHAFFQSDNDKEDPEEITSLRIMKKIRLDAQQLNTDLVFINANLTDSEHTSGIEGFFNRMNQAMEQELRDAKMSTIGHLDQDTKTELFGINDDKFDHISVKSLISYLTRREVAHFASIVGVEANSREGKNPDYPLSAQWLTHVINGNVGNICHQLWKESQAEMTRIHQILSEITRSETKFNDKIHLLFASTSEVYGDAILDEGTMPQIHFNDPIRGGYVAQKLNAEYLFSGLPFIQTTIVRLFNIIGPGQDPSKGVIPKFLSQLDNNLKLFKRNRVTTKEMFKEPKRYSQELGTILKYGQGFRHYTPVGDAVDTIFEYWKSTRRNCIHDIVCDRFQYYDKDVLSACVNWFIGNDINHTTYKSHKVINVPSFFKQFDIEKFDLNKTYIDCWYKPESDEKMATMVGEDIPEGFFVFCQEMIQTEEIKDRKTKIRTVYSGGQFQDQFQDIKEWLEWKNKEPRKEV